MLWIPVALHRIDPSARRPHDSCGTLETLTLPGERRLRILSRLAASGAFGLETKRLCEACAEVTGMSGAGLMLMSDDLPTGTICSTDEVSALIEQLQYTLGQGPCVDAYQYDRPVLEPDLADPGKP